MKALNPNTGNLETVYVKALDSMPVGAEIDFDGQASDIPVGWEEIDTYSTSEVKTGQNWIDGKPIYRKVVDFGALPNNTSKSVNHDISNLDLIVNIRGISKNPTSSSVIPIPDNIASNIAGIYVDDTKIGIYTNNSNWTSNDTYIILEYTKTTD